MALIGLILCPGLFITFVAAVAAQEPDASEPKGKEATVTTTNKSLRIRRALYLDEARFATRW